MTKSLDHNGEKKNVARDKNLLMRSGFSGLKFSDGLK